MPYSTMPPRRKFRKPPAPDTIDHVAIAVRDIAEAVRWFRAKFLCNVTYQDTSFAMLRFRNVSVSLVIPEQHPPHIAVVRPDAQQFGELTTHRDGTRSVYITDPFHNIVEIQAAALPAGA